MPGKVLVTGYEPFGGSPVNPTGRAAQALDGAVIAGHQVIGRVLPVRYQEAIRVMASLIEEFQPHVVIMSGQSGRPDIAIEKVAVNVSGPGGDNVGHDPHEEPVVVGGPAAYFSTLPITATMAALHEAGIPASVSYTAGTYLCNHIFYGTLHYLRDRDIPAGFFHVPSLPEQKLHQRAASMSQEMITSALRIATKTALEVRGLPLHRYREHAELFMGEREAARLGGGPVGDYPELGRCDEIEFLLGRREGQEAERLRLLRDFSNAHRGALRRRQALSLWKQGDYQRALNTLSPDHLTSFAERGGAELLPFAERMLARSGNFEREESGLGDEWDNILTPDRLKHAMQAARSALGLDETLVQWRDQGTTPQAVLTDRVWLELAPEAGWTTYFENFSALGQALHLACMPQGLPWEYRRLGDPATLRASGELLSGLLYRAPWLNQYLEIPESMLFVERLEARRTHRWRQKAALVQAYQRAKIVEKKVENGEQKTVAIVECIIEATDSTREAVKAFIDWEENLVDFRSLLFENGLRAYLVTHYGQAWWNKPEAGAYLCSLWRQGLEPSRWWGLVQK